MWDSGSALREPDCDEEEETEKCEKNKAEKIPWKTENQNSDELNLASALPSPPSRFRRFGLLTFFQFFSLSF